MKLSINRSELADALTIAGSVVPVRTPKPVLQCILLDAHKDFVLVCATDLEIGVRCSVSQVQVDKPGSALLAADKIQQIVRESSDDIITLELTDSICHIRGHDAHFQIFAQDAKSFPPIAEAETDFDFEVEPAVLRDLSDWTIFAAARENTRYAINGVLWEKKGDKLTLVATDGRRLSKAVGEIKNAKADRTAIVPTKGMQLFGRVLSEAGGPVGIKITPSQIMLKSSRALVTASLLEGHFPRYQDVIPEDCDKKVMFDAQELLSAVRRAALLTNEESKGVRLAFRRGKLTLSSRAADQGEAVVELPAEYKGADVDIGFNPLFLTDVLRVVAQSPVSFEFKEANRPGMVRSGENKLYVVMPVNLS